MPNRGSAVQVEKMRLCTARHTDDSCQTLFLSDSGCSSRSGVHTCMTQDS